MRGGNEGQVFNQDNFLLVWGRGRRVSTGTYRE